MSLDVSLIMADLVLKKGTGVFVRKNGQSVELTVGEVAEAFPGSAVKYEESETCEVFSANITHNLGHMAAEAGIYKACWRPEELGISRAKDLIPLLEKGLQALKEDAEHFKKFNASNGWGVYKDFIPWVENYLQACKDYPEAIIRVSR